MDDDNVVNIKKIMRRRGEESEEEESQFDLSPPVPEIIVEESEGTMEAEIAEFSGSPSGWEKIGRACVYLLAILTPVFFLPWTLLPVDINKQAFAAALASLGLICYAADAIKTRRFIYPKGPLPLAMAVFLLVAGVSAYFSIAPKASWIGNLSLADTFLSLAAGVVTYFLVFRFMNREGDFERIARWFFVVLGFIGVLGLLQLFQKFILPFDFAKNSAFNPIGGLAGWGIFLGAGLSMLATCPSPLEKGEGQIGPIGLIRRIGPIALAAIFLLGLIFLNYRFIWIVLSAVMILIASYKFVAKENLRWPLALTIIAIFFAAVSRSLPALVFSPAEVWPSYSTTLTIAKNALSGARSLTGSGPGTFGYDYSLGRPKETNQTVFWNVRFGQGYNFFATLFTTMGLLGFLAFLFLIFSFFRTAYLGTQDRRIFSAAIGVLFFAAAWLFYPAFFSGLMFVFFGMGIVSSLTGTAGATSLTRERFGAARRFRSAKPVFAFLILIFLAAFGLTALYKVSVTYASAIQIWRGALEAGAGDLGKSIASFNQAVRLNPDSDEAGRFLSQVLVLRARQTAAGNPAVLAADKGARFQSDAAQGVNAALEAAKINQSDSLNWENLGLAYEGLIGLAGGAQDFAAASYRRAAELDPQNPGEPLNVARVQVTVANLVSSSPSEKNIYRRLLDEASKSLAKSLELKPDYAPANFLLAQVYIREGDTEKAIAKVQEVETVNPNDVGLAFQLGILYYQSNQIDLAQRELERAVSLSSDYSNARYFLGLVYDREGLKSQAIDQFQKILALNPDSAEVTRILTNLNAGRSALQDIVPPAPPPEKRKDVPVPDKKNR